MTQWVSSYFSSFLGTWGLVILDREDPSRLLVAKNGSPMLIGVAEGRTFVASEPSAFVRYTKNFIALQDREIAVVTATGHSLDDSRTMVTEVERPEVSPDPFPNWTIKEIMEQPQVQSNIDHRSHPVHVHLSGNCESVELRWTSHRR